MIHYTIHITPNFNDKSQIGHAIQHKDGTITAYLGAIPINKQIVLVPVSKTHEIALKVACE